MKIDSHQHYWHFNEKDYGWMGDSMQCIKRDFLPVDLLPLLHKAGFDGSIAVQARQSLEETNWLLQLTDHYPHIKGVVGWIDLCSEDAAQQLANFARHPRAVGVRHVIHDETDIDFMLRPEFIRGVQLLEQYRLTYDILIFPKHLPNTLKFVDKFSNDQVFVVDHLAKPLIKEGILSPWKEHIRALSNRQNVYCKLSGMVTEADWQHHQPSDFKPYLDVVFETFGSERLMIGSDWPVCQVAGTYSSVMEIVCNYIADLSTTDQENILGRTAQKAYRIF